VVNIDFGQSTTVDAINADYEARNVPRSRLGLSQAGHQCKRCLWYTHHGFPAKQPEGRVLRLFQLGNILEDQTIIDLKSAGVLHHSNQKEVRHSRGDITLTGHIDGIVEGLLESPETPHLFEHKTCSLKKYNELLKCGSYQKWNETYYWQVQFYMLGLKLTRAAVFVYCKDNSALYMERIKLDRQATIDKLHAVFDAISEAVPPKRSCPTQAWHEAKWCNYYDECWKQ
jgi:CRISPR/Cas system-associated exonuclease Cas4 (RecB family)